MNKKSFQYWIILLWLVACSSMAVEEQCLPAALEQINTSANELAITAGPQVGQFIFERRYGEWGQQGYSSELLIYDCQSEQTESLSFTGLRDAGDPYFDKTDHTLWLTSKGVSKNPKTGADIFKVRFNGSSWNQPIRLPAPVNSAEDEYSPIPRSGKIYFASARGGDGNLYVAERSKGSWQVRALSSTLNADTGEWNLWVSENEQWIIFEASGRLQNITVSGDLYISQRSYDNGWSLPSPTRRTNAIGSQLNPRRIGNRLVYASSAGRKHTDLVMIDLDLIASIPYEE